MAKRRFPQFSRTRSPSLSSLRAMHQVTVLVAEKDHDPVSLLMLMKLFTSGIVWPAHERSILFVPNCVRRQKTKQIAEHLGKSDFKASNGWLEKWKKRHNVKRMKIAGESGDVRGETVDSWQERIPELVQGYAKEDIWNLDETGCFWRALPDRGFAKKWSQCEGGKKAKQSMTVALIANAAGGTETAIVIWKSEKPRCFKSVDKGKLPQLYYSQANAWMNGTILDQVLTKLNRQLSRKG